MNLEPFWQAVDDECRAIKPEIERLFAEQWRDPELPGMEYRSSARLAEWLRSSGFDVEHPAAGIPTAFIARFRLGPGPVVAILAEYDALPGLDNDSLPRRQSLGKQAGHACGHNHIGPANAGAAIAAARACLRLGLGGEIRVVGCPAEEILWGKIALLRAGSFSDVDGLLTSHGDYQTGAISRPCQAVVSGEVVFSGQAGHGGQTGHRNALLVAEEVVIEATRLLESEHRNVLLRHVLRQAGVMPSITPSETRIWFSTRGADYEQARSAYEGLIAVAARVAGRSGVAFRHQFISETRGYLPNDTLGRLLHEAMLRVGPPQWSEDDLSFMEELCSACAPGEAMDLDRGVHYVDEGLDQYGQDDGELSWRIPLGRVNWAYPKQVPIHHWAWTALSGHRASHAGPLAASKSLALATVALLANPACLETASTELQQRLDGRTLSEPRIGAMAAMTADPKAFWDASWTD